MARSFSGDKEQLVPILKAAVAHRGFALVDVISPCVTFNDHEGSTKSYLHMRRNSIHATETDFVPPASEVLAEISATGETSVALHDGSIVRFSAVPPDYDPSNKAAVTDYLRSQAGTGRILTGLLYLDEKTPDVHELNKTPATALSNVPYEKLCPGADALQQLQQDFR